MIRNPNALNPLPDDWFGAAVEGDSVEGKHVSTFREPFLPYWSLTKMYAGHASNKVIRSEMAHIHAELAKALPMI